MFSLIRQKKTDFRSAPLLDCTLDSILTVKWLVKSHALSIQAIWRGIKEFKKATREYNKEPCKK